MRKTGVSWNVRPYSRQLRQGLQPEQGHTWSGEAGGDVLRWEESLGDVGVCGDSQRTRIPSASGAGLSASLDGIEPAFLESLAKTSNAVSAAEDDLMRRRLADAARRARAISGHWDFAAPARTIDSFLELQKNEAVGVRLRRAAVARLLLDHFELPAPLPKSVSALFPEHFARLARFLEAGPADRYVDDYYVKDVRYALGVTIPCGMLQMDIAYRIGPKLVMRDAVCTRSLRVIGSYITYGGWERWGNNHIDLRAMNEFHLAGWTAAFLRVAEVLEMQPALRGIAGVSWFYDPALARISPSLAWLHQIPLRHGAFLIRMKTTEDDIRNATIRSAARRALYDKGEYRPARYLLAWPRDPIIAWARKERGTAVVEEHKTPGAPLVHGSALP